MGSLRRLLRPARRPGRRARPDAAGGRRAPALGPAHRGRRPPLRGHLALRRRPHPARLRPRRRRDLPAGRRRALPRSTRRRATSTWSSRPWRRTSAWTWRWRPRNRLGAGSSWSGTGPEERRLRAPGRAHRRAARLARRRRDRRALRALPGAALPAARGLRHHAARGDGGGAAGASRSGRAARTETVVPPGGAEPPTGLFFARQTVEDRGRRHPALRGGRRPRSSRRPCAAGPRPSTARIFKERIQRVPARAARGAPPRAEGALAAARAAHAGGRPRCSSRLCWLLAYWLRFYVLGPPLPYAGRAAAVSDYLLMLLPILVVWGVSFRAFGLYRPRRIGSHLSEAADIAKASTLGALVLVAVMTFFFRGYDYSRVVIVYFWLLSIAAVWLLPRRVPRGRSASRGAAATTCATRSWSAAASWPPPWCSACTARPDVGIQVLGRGGRRQGRHGRGAPARRLRGPARGARRAHGGPRHPRPRPRGLRAARRAARRGRRRAGDHPRGARSLPLRLAARRRRGVRGHAVHPPARVAALRLEPAWPSASSTSCSRCALLVVLCAGPAPARRSAVQADVAAGPCSTGRSAWASTAGASGC